MEPRRILKKLSDNMTRKRAWTSEIKGSVTGSSVTGIADDIIEIRDDRIETRNSVIAIGDSMTGTGNIV